jgi:hypothetical protein
MLDQYKEELEALALRWGVDAKDKAERILNASLLASKDAMGGIMQESAKATAAAMRSEIESALTIVANNLRATRTIGILNVVASCITMLASAVGPVGDTPVKKQNNYKVSRQFPVNGWPILKQSFSDRH